MFGAQAGGENDGDVRLERLGQRERPTAPLETRLEGLGALKNLDHAPRALCHGDAGEQQQARD